VLGGQEPRIELDRLAPPLVTVHDFIAYVKGEPHQAARPEDAGHLGEGAPELFVVEVDDRVKGDGADQRAIVVRQVEHVAHDDIERRKQPHCLSGHPGREVKGRNVDTSLGEVSAHVRRPAAQLYNTAATTNPLSKAIEELAIERLVGQLAGELGPITLRDAVIRVARVLSLEQSRQPPPPTGPVGRL
jgi:hypothetical protein